MGLHKPPPGARIRLSEEGFINKEHINRIIGSVLILVCIVTGIFLGGWVWSVIASVAAIGSMAELYRLMSTKYRLSRGWGLAGGVFILVSVSLGVEFSITLSILPIVAMLVLFTEVLRRQSTGHSYAL
ncbi:MAG: hypothetical protein LBQ58_00945, partial [Synergistaceae bacterium]|nr:hypothetical protein [Synergistaceae bacterium]